MASLEIHRAAPEDGAHVRRLVHEYIRWGIGLIGPPPPHLASEAYAELADPLAWLTAHGGVMLLGSVEGRALGMVGVRPLGAEAEIRRMYVRPLARGLGAGRALFDAALAEASALGCARVFLETSPGHMSSAYRIYRAAGMQVAPARKLRGVLDAVGMEMELRAARTWTARVA
jgi:GNAT superfamily N-acetyltransferase